MPLAHVNGIELYYEVHGEGPALVFAHGAGGNHLSWWQQVPALSREFRCVTFDHRCFGQSRDVPNGPGPRAFVDDLGGLLDHLKIEKAALVGQSMGGRTVFGFATSHPERTAALILSDTTAGMDDPDVMSEQQKAHDDIQGQLSRVLERAYSPEFPKREPARWFLYREISRLNVQVPPDLVQSQTAARYPVEPIVRGRVPTMLIVGEEDALTTPRAMELMARRIPNSRFAKVPGSGHSVYFEQPEEYNRLVGGFLRETIASGR